MAQRRIAFLSLMYKKSSDPGILRQPRDDALVSPGSESGLPRSIPELVRNVVGWALSLEIRVRGCSGRETRFVAAACVAAGAASTLDGCNGSVVLRARRGLHPLMCRAARGGNLSPLC
jgi:hypothetical protein